ncbi:hypothetical protein C8035_v007814 [Colletotrichum spinosum]|uniref:Uncharacterized protein n=1 Tax=Colletotrichum spinosum TaxID=1347390 RepID=A0A4R8QF93_9PEZI|nr:hypothetical protein C8035_v007814 [Colletotrichum spinosum]
MKYQAVAFATSTLMGLASAGSNHQHHHGHVRRVEKREVPLEHSHELYLKITGEFLNKNNPKKIGDPVFGLLGDAAAIKGAGQVTNLACLHQETADQAFTNAKAAKDIRGMSGALVYAALERNTQGVGKTSDACTDKAVNPEIAAIKQHQDRRRTTPRPPTRPSRWSSPSSWPRSAATPSSRWRAAPLPPATRRTRPSGATPATPPPIPSAASSPRRSSFSTPPPTRSRPPLPASLPPSPEAPAS